MIGLKSQALNSCRSVDVGRSLCFVLTKELNCLLNTKALGISILHHFSNFCHSTIYIQNRLFSHTGSRPHLLIKNTQTAKYNFKSLLQFFFSNQFNSQLQFPSYTVCRLNVGTTDITVKTPRFTGIKLRFVSGWFVCLQWLLPVFLEWGCIEDRIVSHPIFTNRSNEFVKNQHTQRMYKRNVCILLLRFWSLLIFCFVIFFLLFLFFQVFSFLLTSAFTRIFRSNKTTRKPYITCNITRT